ncbi:MAG: hypothetical protein ABT940_06475 [Alphaproteobacteria bacterium]
MSEDQHANHKRLTVNVEMDDRTALFPDGKFLTHISITENPVDMIRLEALFHFNETRLDPLIALLAVEDAKEFGRSIMDSVFQGRTQHVLSDHAKIGIVFNPNGFVIKFGDGRSMKELFIASPTILRLAQGILRIVDNTLAVPPH